MSIISVFYYRSFRKRKIVDLCFSLRIKEIYIKKFLKKSFTLNIEFKYSHDLEKIISIEAVKTPSISEIHIENQCKDIY